MYCKVKVTADNRGGLHLLNM